MLKKYKIKEEHKNEGGVSFFVPGRGMMPLDADIINDDIAEASLEAGGEYFEELVASSAVASKSNAAVVESNVKPSKADDNGK